MEPSYNPTPVMSWKIRPTRGNKRGKIKIININRRKILYLYINTLTASYLWGKNVINNQWPSRGGTGNKLNTASKIFKTTIKLRSSGTSGEENTSGKNLRVRPNNKASNKFERGPAMATLAGPYLRSRSCAGSYGTGLA